MNEQKLCVHCGSRLEETKTTFTVAKRANVYVVHDVPTLECTGCGDQSYEQEVAKKLERVASGRWTPFKSIPAWVYRWDDQWLDSSQGFPFAQTHSTPLAPAATSSRQLAGMLQG